MDLESMLEQLEYENYLAEKQMLDELSIYQVKLMSPVLTEASEIVLQEAMKDSIMKYIRKIVGGTQNVWNKFKQGILDKGANKLYETNRRYFDEKSSYVMKPPKDFELPLIEEYTKFISNTTIPAYTNTMDDQLSSVDDFLKHQFTMYAKDLETKKLKQIAEEKLIKKATGEENIGINRMKDIVRFAVIDYKKITDQLSTNLKNLNSSTRTMESLLKMSQSVNGVKSESYSIEDTMRSYFSEMDENNQNKPGSIGFNKSNSDSNNSNDNKEEDRFRDANSNPKNDEEKEKQKKMDDIAKVYFKAITSVISDQLSITNKLLFNCIRMMNEYVKGQIKKDKISGEEKDVEKEKKNTEEDKEDLTPTQIQL